MRKRGQSSMVSAGFDVDARALAVARVSRVDEAPVSDLIGEAAAGGGGTPIWAKALAPAGRMALGYSEKTVRSRRLQRGNLVPDTHLHRIAAARTRLRR